MRLPNTVRGHWPARLRLTNGKALRASIFWCTLNQRSNAGADVYEFGRGLVSSRMPQLASIPKTKRQAARQSTDNGTDEDSNERKPRQRPASRCWNSADVRVQRVDILTPAASFKRLIPYSKQSESIWAKDPKGLRYV